MSKTKHTPGPWRVNWDDTERGMVAIDGNLLRQRGGLSHGETWLCMAQAVIQMDGEPSEEGRKNALLIAAAPDLLEALQAYHNFIGTCDMSDAPDHVQCRLEAIRCQAQVAINRATGGDK